MLLDRQIVVDAIAVPGARIVTDAWGRIRDGKPRIRRTNPNNHSILNVPALIAALALLPDPIREDPGKIVLPLRDKGYVIRTIGFSAENGPSSQAICTPQRLKILHDTDEIDLVARLLRVGEFVARTDLPSPARQLAEQYKVIISAGLPSAKLRAVADGLVQWLRANPEFAEAIESPSDEFTAEDETPTPTLIDLSTLSADETKKRLVSHYKIERSDKIRNAKVKQFADDHAGHVFCENCTFEFERRFGEHGKGYIEVHHKQPLAAILPNTVTRLVDLLLLCANCHRMVHRKSPPLSPAKLEAITNLRYVNPS